MPIHSGTLPLQTPCSFSCNLLYLCASLKPVPLSICYLVFFTIVMSSTEMIVELHSWENFAMYPPRACTSVRPRQRATNMKSQTFLQEWRTKLHLWSLKSMLWSIVSCQNRVSADHYHMTVSAHRGYMIFEVIRWQVTSFQLIAGSTLSGSFSGFISVSFHLFSGTLTGQTPSSFSCNLLYLCPFLKPAL